MKKTIVILLLVGLNIAMGILLFRRNSQLNHFAVEMNKQNEDIIVLRHNLEKCYTSFVKANNKSIKLFLNLAGIGAEIESPLNNQSLFALIPPHPCDVCLDNEIEHINKRCKESNCSIVVITPEFRVRDLRIKFNNNPAIKFIKYDIDMVNGEEIADLDAVIYFRNAAEIVYDVFVPNSSHKQYSQAYISNFLI